MTGVAEAALGSQDLAVQKVLRSYGRQAGRYPVRWASLVLVLCLALGVAGWVPRLTGSRKFFNQDEQAVQWSVKGGESERNIKMWISKHGIKNPWMKPYSTTMFVGKGDWAGKDVLTREALEEMYGLHKKYRSLTVTVDGLNGPLEYTIWDLCDRGMLPDVPIAPFMPCADIGPMQCFYEQHSLNHESFQQIDPILQSIPAFAALSPVPYSTRPSFRNMTDAEIKATVTALTDPTRGAEAMRNPRMNRGCFFWTATVPIVADIWAASGDEWSSDGKLTKLLGFRTLFYLDGGERIQYRMALAKPSHSRFEDIEEAKKKMSAEWQKTCVEYNKKTKVLEVSNLEDWDFYSGPSLEDDLEQVKWGFTLAGVALMVVFCNLTTVSLSHPQASRASAAGNGLTLILVSTLSSLGIFFLLGRDLNGPLMIGVPLLALGLGVDDMFVLLRYFSDLGQDFLTSHSNEEIIGELMARAGAGTTLTSVCNVLVFTCGTFFPIPAMADFCMASLCVAGVNYIMTMNVFVPLLVLEIARIKKGLPELTWTYFCHRRMIKAYARDQPREIGATCSGEFAWSIESELLAVLRKNYVPAVASLLGRSVTSLLALVFLGLACYFVGNKSVGYAPSELFSTSNPASRAMDLVFNRFALFPTFLCFHDIDVAANQEQMLTLFNDITQQPLAAPHVFPPWITFWHQLLYLGALGAVGGNMTVLPAVLQSMGFDRAVSTMADPNYGLKTLLPAGPLLAGNPGAFYDLLNEHRKIPAPAQAYNTSAHTGLFSYLDLVHINEFSYENIQGQQRPEFTFFPFFGTGLISEDLFVKAIREQQGAVRNSPLKDKAFIYGPIFTFWEVFLELDVYLWALLGIGMAIIFFVTLVAFSLDVVTAAITSISCLMIVVEIFGVSSALMNFNVFVASISLMGLGLSVEFTAHLAAAFSLGHGSPAERLGDAMSHTFPALMEGSLSTFLSVLPLAFHPQLFVVKYLFGIIALVVVIGVLNGVVFMPALLAMCSSLISLCRQGGQPETSREKGEGSGPKSVAVPNESVAV